MRSLVYGVGVNDKAGIWSSKEYRLWACMLKRCYSKNYQARGTSYIDCSVSENFRSLSYFYDWCQNQVGFNEKDFNLDKDILVKGNKVYSEDTCVFVPRKINTLFERCGKSRGEYPIGVYLDKRKSQLKAYMRIDGKMKHLGNYNDVDSAFRKYKESKEAHIKSVAEKYKEVIDDRVYKAMMEYQVDITD